ncbi:MAG TPA: hypothetical protein PK006_10075 [Saprospiraceae bacterium]|nr:hypothetical protein [Saprospiraceae bacterium]
MSRFIIILFFSVHCLLGQDTSFLAHKLSAPKKYSDSILTMKNKIDSMSSKLTMELRKYPELNMKKKANGNIVYIERIKRDSLLSYQNTYRSSITQYDSTVRFVKRIDSLLRNVDRLKKENEKLLQEKKMYFSNEYSNAKRLASQSNEEMALQKFHLLNLFFIYQDSFIALLNLPFNKDTLTNIILAIKKKKEKQWEHEIKILCSNNKKLTGESYLQYYSRRIEECRKVSITLDSLEKFSIKSDIKNSPIVNFELLHKRTKDFSVLKDAYSLISGNEGRLTCDHFSNIYNGLHSVSDSLFIKEKMELISLMDCFPKEWDNFNSSKNVLGKKPLELESNFSKYPILYNNKILDSVRGESCFDNFKCRNK